MSALASGADWLFIPEAPPEDGWENCMCERLGEVSAQSVSSLLWPLWPLWLLWLLSLGLGGQLQLICLHLGLASIRRCPRGSSTH